ncbi:MULTISPECIES: hypothetical protein [Pseudomonas]|nr:MULTISPECIES: hypothetical protein [Pseudomonas]
MSTRFQKTNDFVIAELMITPKGVISLSKTVFQAGFWNRNRLRMD